VSGAPGARERFARLLTLPATPRGKWVALAVWVLAIVVAAPFAARFEDAQENRPSSFLPGGAESVEALELTDEFPSGEVSPAIVVYSRADGPLTAADRARIAEDRSEIADADIPGAGPPVVTERSEDGSAQLMVVPITAGGDSELLIDAVDEIRAIVGDGEGELAVAVTGPAGFTTDAVKIFGSINGTLLLATVALVFVLLILIYRSPVFWILPLAAVLFAEFLVRGIGYGIASSGVVVNGQTSGILLVLVFGAGTDYALLLVSRYREELRQHEDRHDAMALALRRSGPAILASAGTNVAALLCLLAAEVNGTQGLGPVGAMGIAVAMLSVLTALPALLVIAGRRAFWPFIPAYGTEVREQQGLFRKLGDAIARGPRRVWIGAAVVLGVMALGLATLDSGLTQADDFRDDVESVAGQEAIAAAFPAGAVAPSTVIVEDPARAEEVRRALESDPRVASLGPPETGPPGVKFDLTLEAPPYSQEAFDAIPALREVADEASGGAALIGGPTAEEADLRTSVARDNVVIIPLVLAVVLIILAVLLRALVAPLVLIATVVLSFAAALGVSAVVFDVVFGFPGESPSLPLFAFVFLVALGVDYNIFLVTRVREESARHGTHEGTVRGLAATGAVITAAGIVLAGTFSVLGVLPLVTLTEIGFVVAFGVLLDTFLVRSVLVPALVLDLGWRTWWPSGLDRPAG
jgi:RND superfamily putative drug exporter